MAWTFYEYIHPVLHVDGNTGGFLGGLGSCFRLWSAGHFLTANHCIGDLAPEEVVILDALSEGKDTIACRSIHQHNELDLAVLTVTPEDVPTGYKQCHPFTEMDIRVGAHVASFGPLYDQPEMTRPPEWRMVAGYIQRDYVEESDRYRFDAAELSFPVPRGLSGAPVFLYGGSQPLTVTGMAVGTIRSQVPIWGSEPSGEAEGEHDIVRYGVMLRLHPVLRILEDQLGPMSSG